MKLPRKGILIRLAIYVPIIAFLAYSALTRGSRSEEPAAPTRPGKVRTMTMPDGSEVEYLQVTPEEARQMGYNPQLPPEEAQ